MKKLSKNRRLVLRLSLYLEQMGVLPINYEGQPLSEYVAELQEQYQMLKGELGQEAYAAARASGRQLIRTLGFAAIQATLETAHLLRLDNRQTDSGVHGSMSGKAQAVPGLDEKERLLCHAASNCRRKWMHLDYLSAILHARRLADQDLNIYPCPVCFGLHVGHRQDAEARRRRSIIKELGALNPRIAELGRRYADLLEQRKKLAAALEVIESGDSP